MLEVRKNCVAVISRVILIGFCIQIVLGILWMCNAFARMNSFGEGIVCVTQMLVLGGVLWYVMPGNDFSRKLFRVFAIESFPMVLQTLMKPDLRVWMAILFLLGFGVCRRRVLIATLLSILCIGAGMGIGYVAAPETDLLTLAAGRMAWTTLFLDYKSLSDEDSQKINYTAMEESTYEARGIETIFVPEQLKYSTKEELRKVLRILIRTAWENHKSRIVKEIGWDGAGYLMPPVVMTLQLEHRAYDSRTGLNYRLFLQPNAVVGKYAMRYGNAWFAAAFVLRSLSLILSGRRLALEHPVWYIPVTAGVVIVWYTFSTAGCMDYHNSFYILCLWLMWMTEGAAFGVGQKRAGSKEASGNDGCAEEK